MRSSDEVAVKKGKLIMKVLRGGILAGLVWLMPLNFAFSQDQTPVPTLTPASAPTAVPSPTAVPTKCKKVTQLSKFRQGGILYKPENEHGGRGASFLVQNFRYWYGPKKKKIYDSNCKKVIGRVVFWSLGFPYGERYYSRLVGGSWDSGASLAKKARAATRKRGGIIIVNSSLSVAIADFRKREGFVRNP